MFKTPDRSHGHRSGAFTVNFERYFTPFSSVSTADFDFEQVNVS